METVFSGKGFGIWVMNKRGRLFVGNHKKGLIHHSSFLAGGDVLCGGEMVARDGKIRVLTNKSGHYQPTMDHLVWALRVLEICAGNYHDIKIVAGKVSTTGPVHLISPATLRANPNLWHWVTPTAQEINQMKRA
jgi:hypothetical protein